jgi:O-antigen ligase
VKWTKIQPETRSEWRTRYAVTYALLLVAAVGVCYIYSQLEVEPIWAMAAIAVGLATLIAFVKWPIVMFAGLLFVGDFKTIPAKGIALSDPTMLIYLLCCGAIVTDWLKASISSHRESSRGHLFDGQALKISLFMLFTAALAASFLYTPAEQYGRMKLLRFLTFETLAFFGPILLLKNEKGLRPLLWAMVVLSFPLLAKEIIRVWHPSLQVLRGDVDVTEMGHGEAFGVAILIALYSRLIRFRILLVCVVGLMSVGMITAAARTPALSLGLTLVISSFALRACSPHFSLLRMLPILCLITILGALTFFAVRNTAALRAKLAGKQNEVVSMTSGSTATDGTIARRLDFYNSALDAVAQHPFTGLGLGGWSVFYSGQVGGQKVWTYPHDLLLEVASEQGLLGLALLLGLLASLFHSAWKVAKYPQFAFLLPVFIFEVFNRVFTGSIEDRNLWFWFGMVVALSRMVHHSEPRGVWPSRNTPIGASETDIFHTRRSVAGIRPTLWRGSAS